MSNATAAPARCTYRKTKSGTWAVMGPVDTIRAGATVTVTKRDGSMKTEEIKSVGRSFDRDGQQMAYGYPAPRQRQSRSYSRRNTWMGSYSCQDCQDIEDMSDGRGCTRHRGNPQN